ncbi:hypothetical protein OG539_32940 [Actinacidiphila glaucinigra]|uniref:hypothetical protein n=1 Tax=Actinacidiphila glaucinigra TaxID=235986 RepID=UPI003254BD76
MSAISIPQHLVDLQRAADAAQDAVRQHHRANGPVLDWDADTRAEGNRLQDGWRERAAELQAAIEEHGQEPGQGYEYRQALRKAARG